LALLLEKEDYEDPLRQATRAEVVYAAYRVLKENGVLDFDKDGVVNKSDQCPCVPALLEDSVINNGCPIRLPDYIRRERKYFEGIEIMQHLDCRCLILVDPDLYAGSRFFAVITGVGAEETSVFVKSNEVQAEETRVYKVGKVEE